MPCSHPSFEQVVRAHAASVHRYCRALCSSNAAADDLFQETFVAALRGYDGFRGEASVRTWLFTIARNKSYRLGKKARILAEREEPLMELGLAAGWSQPEPERYIEALEDRSRLQRSLDSLESHDRQVLVLRELEELTTKQTAQVLGIGESAVRVRLHRARLRFAAAFRKLEDDHDT